MNSYRIFETAEFSKKLEGLNFRNNRFIKRKLMGTIYPQLRQNPYYGQNIKKLRDYDPVTYRFRSGKFRIFYIIDKEARIVYILTIDHRKDIYR